MNDSLDYNKLLSRHGVNEFEPATHYAAGIICDMAVTDGLQFTQEANGNYIVEEPEVPAATLPEWATGAATLIPPSEIPPHNPTYVSIGSDINGDEVEMVSFNALDKYGRANGINLNALRNSFNHAIGWLPAEYTIKGVTDYRSSSIHSRVGVKLSALPMAVRLVTKANIRWIYDYYYGSNEKIEQARNMFLAFATAVLTIPEQS